MAIDRPDVVKPNALFHRMLESAVNQKQANPALISNFHHIALDPGETTGMATKGLQREEIRLLQIKTPNVEEGMAALTKQLQPFLTWDTIITVEDYKVYGWKADSHKWAGLHTPMLIGALRYFISLHPKLHLHLRLAQQAKGFATDDNLKRWNLYEAGMKHARDAERHLVTTLFFGKDII